MRKTFFLFFLNIVLSVDARFLDTDFFGERYDVAKETIVEMLGTPREMLGEDEIRYDSVEYNGMVWDEAYFRFTEGLLTEARFYSKQLNKTSALHHATEIAATMKKRHAMTKDYEDRRTFFYKGGRSPMKFGHLFTIFVSPFRGGWSTQLRYGPFKLERVPVTQE